MSSFNESVASCRQPGPGRVWLVCWYMMMDDDETRDDWAVYEDWDKAWEQYVYLKSGRAGDHIRSASIAGVIASTDYETHPAFKREGGFQTYLKEPRPAFEGGAS